jgi:hypothetical protein
VWKQFYYCSRVVLVVVGFPVGVFGSSRGVVAGVVLSSVSTDHCFDMIVFMHCYVLPFVAREGLYCLRSFSVFSVWYRCVVVYSGLGRVEGGVGLWRLGIRRLRGSVEWVLPLPCLCWLGMFPCVDCCLVDN